MTVIGLKELRQNAGQIAERALEGERFTVVKRSKTMFVISPPPTENTKLDGWLDDYMEENHDLLVALKDK